MPQNAVKGANSMAMIIVKFVFAVILVLAACELLFLDITSLGRRKAMRQFPVAAKTFGFCQTAKQGIQTDRNVYRNLQGL